MASEIGPLAMSLDDASTLVDIIGTIVTAAAVIIGGIWAYFNFVKGRTYRPRLEVGLSAQWHAAAGPPLFHLVISVKNIGSSKVDLVQKGTGIRVSRPQTGPTTPDDMIEWSSVGVFEIFTAHEWIEPSETITDHLLLSLDRPEDPVLLEARLIWKRSSREGNIEVQARQMVFAGLDTAPEKDAKSA